MSGTQDEKVTLFEPTEFPEPTRAGEDEAHQPQADPAPERPVTMGESGPQSGMPTHPGSQAESSDDEFAAPESPGDFPPLPVESDDESEPDSDDGRDDDDDEDDESESDDDDDDDEDDDDSDEDDDEDGETVAEDPDDPVVLAEDPGPVVVAEDLNDVVVLTDANTVDGDGSAAGDIVVQEDNVGEDIGDLVIGPEPVSSPGDASSTHNDNDLDFSAPPMAGELVLELGERLIPRAADEEDDGSSTRISEYYEILQSRQLDALAAPRGILTGNDDESDQDDDDENGDENDYEDDDGLNLSSQLDFTPAVPTQGWSWGATNLGLLSPEPAFEAGVGVTFELHDRLQGELDDDVLSFGIPPSDDDSDEEDDIDDF